MIIYKKKPVQFKRHGDRCYKENDFQGALYWYEAGLKNSPGNINLLVSKGNVLFRLYYYDAAMETYFNAIKRKKKTKVIHRFINNYHRNFNDNTEKLAMRLRERHGLNIDHNAVSMLVNYVQSRDASQVWYSQRNKFIDNFNKKTLSCLDDYIDEYLWKYGLYDKYYFQWFNHLCQMKGFSINQFELRKYIDSRKLFWESITHENSKMAPLISAIYRMNGEEFENFIKEFFKKRGYKVSLTKKTVDWGGDLVIRGYTGLMVVQCKRWKEKVGVEAVQEVHTAKDLYKTQHATVITNSYFSNEAKKMAATLGVELWDRTRLIRELMKDF